MARRKRGALLIEAQREARVVAMRLGPEIATSRKGSRLTQAGLARRVGLSPSRIGQIERGEGSEAPITVWIALGLAIGRPVRVDLARDARSEPADAGHLRMQELLLRLGRGHGYRRTFELHTKPSDPSRSTDVGWRDDPRRTLVLLECWNTLGDIGAAARATARKVSEAEQHGVAIAADGPAYAVRSCWVLRATRVNRALVERYPEVFAARFPGSSRRWAGAISDGLEAPDEPGLVWCDTRSTRVYAWRQRQRSR